jgi:ferredoxin-NADP reductase
MQSDFNTVNCDGRIYKVKLILIKKVDEAKGTKSFFFKPEKSISFSAGQYLYYTLAKLNYPDAKGATRLFTIASSPTETDSIRLTTKIREESGYKKTLDELAIGEVIKADGPNGTFLFDENEKGSHVFLAGGIGITPFRSIIKYVVDNKLANPIYLIYSNSDNDIVFKRKFDEIVKNNSNIRVHYVISSTEGHLDQIKINELIKNYKLKIKNCTLWVCGPPGFNDAMEEILGNMKVPSGQIRSEKFTGY